MYLEQLADVKVVAFDKTGTLTIGEPEVTDVIVNPTRPAFAPGTGNALLAVAVAIEQHSEHLLGPAVVQRARVIRQPLAPIEDFKALIGSGASARLDGRVVYAAKPGFFWTEFDTVWRVWTRTRKGACSRERL